MADKKIQWHPGFAAAINLELSANRDDLVYEREYNLNTKPLEVDLLVIKKDKGVLLENEIGRLFREHNILEYKSPDDSLNIDTFYKSAAYACLYKAYGEAVDSRQAGDITVTMVRERKPEGLFKYFATHGIRVEKPYKGIYYVLDSVLFPTQVIVTKELEPGEHIWLKSLSNQLEVQEIRELLECVEGLAEEGEKQLADAVLEVCIRANRKIVEELRGDEGMCEALLEIMEPEINRMVKEATEKETRRLQEENRKEAERLREESLREAERLREESLRETERLREESLRETERLREENLRETERLREESLRETERLREESRRETERLREENRKEAERLKEENQQEARRLREEARKEAMETAAKMLKSGKFSVEEVKDFISKLSLEEIEEIAKEVGSDYA